MPKLTLNVDSEIIVGAKKLAAENIWQPYNPYGNKGL